MLFGNKLSFIYFIIFKIKTEKKTHLIRPGGAVGGAQSPQTTEQRGLHSVQCIREFFKNNIMFLEDYRVAKKGKYRQTHYLLQIFSLKYVLVAPPPPL
jgi:hypothetical protein